MKSILAAAALIVAGLGMLEGLRQRLAGSEGQQQRRSDRRFQNRGKRKGHGDHARVMAETMRP